MSTTASTALRIPDARAPHIEQATQYGVVWPDGTITWEYIERGIGTTSITIAALVDGADTSRYNDSSVKWSPSYWTELLEGRAAAAKLEYDEYRDKHHFIKRTVILSVTATEEV
jgi:hypothetical protein